MKTKNTRKATHHCPNCESPVTTLFCPNCGQRNAPTQLSWRSLTNSLIAKFIGDRFAGIKGHNARFGILHTLRMLFMRPCTLISEYIAGRQTKYFDPVIMLLLLSTCYMLCASFFETPAVVYGTTDETEYKIFFESISKAIEFYVKHPWLWFMFQLPFLALGMKWLFRRHSTMRYMDYIYVGIFIANFDLTLTIAFLLVKTYETTNMADTIIFIATLLLKIIFMTITFRGLYKTGTIRSLWNCICIQAIGYAGVVISLTIFILISAYIYILLFSDKLL